MDTTTPSRRRLGLLTVGTAVLAGSLVLATSPAYAADPTPEQAWAEMTAQLDALVAEAQADGVRMGVSVTDLSGSYGDASVTVGSEEQYKAASLIKLPLLGLLMDDADHGTLSLDESITIPAGDDNIVGGSGTLRDRAFPLDITVRELMELMVQISDNTATNVLIDRAGGFDAVNEYIAALGYEQMWLGRKMIHPALPPLQENWLNSEEVTDLLTKFYKHEILSPASSEHIIDLMKGQLVDTKFGAVIPREVLANKTGELGDVTHDSGIILVPGREVALAATTAFDPSRPRTEVDLYVQRAATIVYEFVQQPLAEEPVPSEEPTTAPTEAPVVEDPDAAEDAADGKRLAATGVEPALLAAGGLGVVLVALGAVALTARRRSRA
ncbi:serine hydrolase [Compostimonas suwonensis]|uniref:Beta-lactamase class A n=1 Tax=Compostimonas suwonensis TaxID=1048394 RepID=A0A2M9BU93_9MICO|nr:serine hydrolase [Compostimonas suwonensis]PJJ61528.1 beta-lactamase class A [Compostimonas suwonensis]